MIKKHIPNIITSINLISGFLAVIIAYYNITFACYLIFISLILDFFDGFFARMLKAQSEFGKQLDSLSDLVSFGIAPAVILYLLLLKSDFLPLFSISDIYIAPLIVVILPLFAALRLAKFNVLNDQSGFTGLPTPASAFFIISLPLIANTSIEYFSWMPVVISNFYFLAGVIIVLSFLMVSNIKMLKLKLNFSDLKSSWIEILLIALFLVFLFLFEYITIPFIIILYVLLSLFNPSKMNN
ncbi:CDP-diacylglycerol--serine O-phosphatidyltransferase [Bacteroidota bacterium]